MIREVDFTLNVEDNMAIIKYVNFTLEVREAPDFFPAVTPEALVVDQGEVAEFHFSFVPNSTYSGRVKFAVIELTPDAVAVWDKDTIAAGEVAVLTVVTAAVEPGLGVVPWRVKAEEVA